MMLAMKFAEFGCTGSREMSMFHALSAGKTWHPPMRGRPAAGGGVVVGVGVVATVGVRVGEGVAVRVAVAVAGTLVGVRVAVAAGLGEAGAQLRS